MNKYFFENAFKNPKIILNFYKTGLVDVLKDFSVSEETFRHRERLIKANNVEFDKFFHKSTKFYKQQNFKFIFDG